MILFFLKFKNMFFFLTCPYGASSYMQRQKNLNDFFQTCGWSINPEISLDNRICSGDSFFSLFFILCYFQWKCSCQIASKLMWSFRHTWTRSYLRFECNFRFFANALFSASGDNLGLKRTSNSCKQVASAAEAHKKPKCCRVEYLK